MASITDLIAAVEGTVYEDTQRHDAGLDLTVAEVYEITDPGRVDFGGESSEARRSSSDQRSDGGGELEPADLDPHERVWRNEDDDYQWWHLEAGQYLIEYNESLSIDDRVTLQVRDVVRDRGAFHPTLRVSELSRVPLSVGGAGLRLKENARVSTLLAAE